MVMVVVASLKRDGAKITDIPTMQCRFYIQHSKVFVIVKFLRKILYIL